MPQSHKVFPLGSHLCREPMPPMSELKRDMENLKRHGFNLVKLQEQWMADEPLEGQYDFSRYEELIEHAAGLDMGVYLGLTCEQAPGWLWRKYPDCRMVGRNGLPIAYEAPSPLPADGKPGPCYDHPGAMADQVRFIRALVRCLGRYENVVVWNTWQEVGYWAERLVGQDVCYCPHTLDHWRRWLRERYGDLDGLNRAWNSRYGDWAYVLPNRVALGRFALPQDVDWRYFMDNVQVAHVLRARAEAIRGEDPLRRPVFAHKGGPIIGSGQDWTYARCQDFLGSSAYPAWSPFQSWDDGANVDRHTALLAEMCGEVALRYDYIRSCNVRGAPVWAAEFQGGPVSTFTHKGRVPSPEDIRRWMLTAMASGVTALSFWVTRAEIAAAEVNGFSLLDSVGESTPRYEEAARIGRALNRHADLFAQSSWPGAQVAIGVDEWNYQFCQSLLQGGEHLPYSVRGWHRLLWEAGIAVDFLEASELEASDPDAPYVDAYRAIVLPFPLSMSEEAAVKLARYVRGGGSLISEACPGRLDEHGYARRGELSPTMSELFGVRQRSLTMVAEPNSGRRWSPTPRTWGEYLPPAMLEGTGRLDGFEVRANAYVETFEPREAEVCLRYGDEAAGTVRSVGGGRAWLLGTYVGHNGTAYRDERTGAFVRALLAQCGVTPAHEGRLLLRKRVAPDKEAWLFTNPTEGAVTERVDVAGWSVVGDLLGEPLLREGDWVELVVDSLDVRALILERREP
jgi:beta-galactosidase